MLYWICPECGGECSPAVRECPGCSGRSASSPASVASVSGKETAEGDVLALFKHVPAAPAAPPPVASVFEPMVPATKPLHVNGHSARATATLELPELPVESRQQPALDPEPPAPGDETIDSLVQPLIESAPPVPVQTPEPASEPPTEPAPLPEVAPAMELQASLVLDSIERQQEAEESEIRGILASFQQPAGPALLAAPRQVVSAPAPPSLQWMRSPRPAIAPVLPKELEAARFGLQTPPLAGPCIPLDLRNLVETQHPARGSQARKKTGLPAWTVSFLVAITLFLGVGSLLQYWAANRDNKTASSPAASTTGPSDSAPAAEPSSPLTVEVTGLRVLAGASRPRLDFIVVNHSATPLSDVGLRIAVRSSSSPAGAPPLFSIATTVASLGPYQSREFRADLDSGLRAADIPDWQSLRADVRLASQQ